MNKEETNQKIQDYIINDMLTNSAMGVNIGSDIYVALLQDEIEAKFDITFKGNKNQIKDYVEVISNSPTFQKQVSKMTVEDAMHLLMMQSLAS